MARSSIGGSFDVTDPATGEVTGSVPDGGADDAHEAIAAADAASGVWSTTTAHQRQV